MDSECTATGKARACDRFLFAGTAVRHADESRKRPSAIGWGQGVQAGGKRVDVDGRGGADLLGAVLVEQDDEEVAGLDVEAAAGVGLVGGGADGEILKAEVLFAVLEAVETGTKTVLRAESSKLWRWMSSSCRLKSGLLASGAKTSSMRELVWSWRARMQRS